MVILCFKEIEAGKLIFREWIDKLGKIDEQEQLRISIITGIDKRKPASYRVIVSTNPNMMKVTGAHHFIIVNRMFTMEPLNHNNLNNF